MKGRNNSIAENRLVTVSLEFGVVLRFPIVTIALRFEKERTEVFAGTQAEFSEVVEESKIMTELIRIIPLAAHSPYKMRKNKLVYSEKEKKLLGPLMVVDVTRTLITIQI